MTQRALSSLSGFSALSASARTLTTNLSRDAAGSDAVLTRAELDAYAAAHPNMGPQSRRAVDFLRAAFTADATLEVSAGRATRAARTPVPAIRDATPITMTDACREGRRVTLSAVGDLLLHSGLQADANAAGTFSPLLSFVAPELSRADLTLANLETPLARGLTTRTRTEGSRTISRSAEVDVLYDGSVYSGYPRFNVHPDWARSIAASGIDVVTTANNHALDRGSNGIDMTLDALDAAGLAHAGTARYEAGRRTMPADARYTIREVNGVRVAIVGATFSTNGLEDTYHQVASLSERQAVEDIRALRASGDADVIVFAPHWGTEYAHRPSAEQTRIAHAVLDAGADAVVGGHPHVLQPLERYTTRDGRETVIAYSLGNFIAEQSTAFPDRHESAILHLTFTAPVGGRASVSAVQFVPVEIADRFSPEADGMIHVPVLIDTQGGDPAARTSVVNALGTEGNAIAPGATIGPVCSGPHS